MAYRFVHAADIHLDSPLKSLALRDPDLAALIGDATRQAFVRIVDLCLDERVDALLLAGDLYDGDQTSMKTARFLAEQLRRLDAAGIRTFVIRGNHDALSKITRELALPRQRQAVRRPGRGRRARGRCRGRARHPGARPELRPAARARKLPAALQGAGRGRGQHRPHAHEPRRPRPHDRYAPCSARRAPGLGLLLLGAGPHPRPHAPEPPRPDRHRGHARHPAGPRHQRGRPEIRDAGDGAGRPHARRRGARDQRGAVRARAGRPRRRRGLARGASTGSPGRSARRGTRPSRPTSWPGWTSRARRPSPGRCGATPTGCAPRPPCAPEGLGRDLDREASTSPCRRPPAAPAAGDAVAELADLIGTAVLASDAFRIGMAALVEDLSRKLPRECRDAVLGTDEAASEAALARLFAEGAEDVLARLREPAGAGRPDAPRPARPRPLRQVHRPDAGFRRRPGRAARPPHRLRPQRGRQVDRLRGLPRPALRHPGRQGAQLRLPAPLSDHADRGAAGAVGRPARPRAHPPRPGDPARRGGPAGRRGAAGGRARRHRPRRLPQHVLARRRDARAGRRGDPGEPRRPRAASCSPAARARPASARRWTPCARRRTASSGPAPTRRG